MNKTFIKVNIFLIVVNILSATPVITDRLLDQINNTRDGDSFIKALLIINNGVDIEALDDYLYAINASPTERVHSVITALQERAEESQRALITDIKSRSPLEIQSYSSYWLNNMIAIEAKADVLIEYSSRSDLSFMDLDAELFLDESVAEQSAERLSQNAEIGLKAINAHMLWQLGYSGLGRIVMNDDSGVSMNHSALDYKWRGLEDGVEYSEAWFDPVYGNETPLDYHSGSHGTHTMGTMCGLDPVTEDTIGVAFNAKWIASAAPNSSPHTSNSIAAWQWAMDPDENPATINDMPDVINNSWYDPEIDNECDPESNPYIAAHLSVEAAGIALVFSAGNSGPSSSSITAPKNVNIDEVTIFATGAVDGNDDSFPIASFSSRGPVISECLTGVSSLDIKPEVSAPGVDVRSALRDGSYGIKDGTSMASPHVAGSIALLKEAFPNKTGKEIKEALYHTAQDLGVTGEDNNYGMGLIDVYQAYLWLQSPVFTNKHYGDPNSNLYGTLSAFNLDDPSLSQENIPSGESAPVSYGDQYTVQTNHYELEGTDGLKWHYIWNEEESEFRTRIENFEMEVRDTEFTAWFNTQNQVTINSDHPVNVLLQDPWHIQNSEDPNPENWIQTGEDWVETDGTYSVFLDQNASFNPAYPIYSLRAPKYFADTEGIYEFSEWVCTNCTEEDKVDFGGGATTTEDRETDIVFISAGAAVTAEYDMANPVNMIPDYMATINSFESITIPVGAEFTFANNFTFNIEYSGRLTVSPGVKLLMSEGSSIILNYGNLNITGTVEDPISLISATVGGSWSGIIVTSTMLNHVNIENTIIEGAETAFANIGFLSYSIRNNTFANNETAIITGPWSSTYMLIQNNVFISNSTAIEINNSDRPPHHPPVQIHYNLFYDNDTDINDASCQDCYDSSNLLYENPLFIDVTDGNYHLQPSSPCIDAGDPNSPPDPDGTTADIGAFFFPQNVNYAENNAGWNIVGLPRIVDDSHFQSVYPNSTPGTCYGYNSTYYDADTLEIGEGYWLFFNESGVNTIYGEEITDLSIDLSEGWNLISGISEEVPIDNIDDPNGILISGCFYEYDAGFHQVAVMIPGQGYWMRANDAGTIIISSSFQNTNEYTDLMVNANWVKFSTNDGKEKTVYFGVEVPEEEQFNYSLPPLPPDEVMDENFLDARYTTDLKYTATEGAIEVTSSDYPLTVEYGILNDDGEWEISSTAPRRLNGDEEYDDIGRVKLNRTGRIVLEHPVESFIIRKTSIKNLPTEFALRQNYPNPFNPTTTISFSIPSNGVETYCNTSLQVYDITGRLVETLVNGEMLSGYHTVTWDGTDAKGHPVASGMYLYRLKAGDFVETKKLVLLK